MLELLYTFISLFLFLTDNISDVVIVFQDSNCKQDTNLPSDTISMTTSLQSQPAVRPQTGAKTFSTRHKNNIIDFSLKIISHLREKYGQNSFRRKQKFTIDGSPCWIFKRGYQAIAFQSLQEAKTCRFTMESTSMVCLCNQIPLK